MLYNIYRIKEKSAPRAFSIRGIRYEVNNSNGILKVFGWVGKDGMSSDEEVFTSSHGCWEWIRKIDERDE